MASGPQTTLPAAPASTLGPRAHLLYHFCRLQAPAIRLDEANCTRHLERTFELHRRKEGNAASWSSYLDNLYPVDWYVASACLDGVTAAWETLFAARAGRSDCLLMDALRARAARLYPRDEERQDSAVTEFWSQLYAPEVEDGLPVLGRYDGLRPLVPWLIRVFQNWHISQLRRRAGVQQLPEDDLALPLPEMNGDPRWHEAFRLAAHDSIGLLQEADLLVLGLRLRYRLSQREVANLLGVNEGNISRRTDKIREKSLEFIGQRLLDQGWTGDDLAEYVRTEMQAVLLDDSRLSADALARLLGRQGKQLPHDEKGQSA